MKGGGSIPAPAPWPPPGIALLLRTKALALRNQLLHTLRYTPLKLLSAVAAIVLIWSGLYVLFVMIFKTVREDTFQGIVAIPLMLDFFFVALMVMLVFSNAILSYGGLFAPGEPAYLLTRPLAPGSVALYKYLESLLFSSWSLILIGLPLMFAMAEVSTYLPWYYYPLFAVFFVCFVPIPGAVGLLLAWAVGQWFSRIARRVFYLALIVSIGGLGAWLWNVWGFDPADSRVWLKEFFERASLVRGIFLPSRWISSGLHYARDGHLSDALFYLLLTFANALFLSWLVVKIVGRRLLVAYDRVQASGHKSRYDGRYTRVCAGLLFWYLPDHLREIALKDLRTFLRDPTQWSQLMILVGLLGLYVINIPNIKVIRMGAFQSQLLVSFLTVTIVSLFLATFTSRFVYPLVSLEIQQIWLVGLLPMPRGRILFPKLIFALTITLAAGGSVMLMAALLSHSAVQLIVVNMISMVAVCVGLCGLAVGLGARFPMMNERNPAKIANGLGGTINLISSIAMVTALLSVSFVLGLRFRNLEAVIVDNITLLLLGVMLLIGCLSCVIPMWIGRRHFARLEC